MAMTWLLIGNLMLRSSKLNIEEVEEEVVVEVEDEADLLEDVVVAVRALGWDVQDAREEDLAVVAQMTDLLELVKEGEREEEVTRENQDGQLIFSGPPEREEML